MRRFSTLAGPLLKPKKKRGNTVHFRSMLQYDQFIYRIWAYCTVAGAFGLVLLFAGILFWPSHWIVVMQPQSPVHLQNLLMLGFLMALQILMIIGTFSSARATLKARNPVPLYPPKGLRVAFATTRAPGEPVDMVRTTLTAARRIVYKGGKVDCWLLDETADPELQTLCKELGVHYFSRKGIEKWNTPKPDTVLVKRLQRLVRWKGAVADKPDPFFAARTKHGNFNAWRAYIQQQGHTYDILAGVDTDQVPEPNFLMRLLGYFRDPDVAFVVGPQVYGNYKPGIQNIVARWAESQASFFQSTIQRAGNASHSPMFVGTNYAVRTSALDQVNGFQPCITEDMATGIAIHATKNPQTQQTWKSVYTPDVLAVGEGPSTWGPYFTQQWRWAAGAFDTWRHMFWRIISKAPRRTILHYFLIMTFYPISALTWLLAVLSGLMYMTSGATAVIAPWGEFVSLYLMSMVMQLSLYFWNRRFNVSPHEPEGSWGVGGMVISSLAAPVYLSALFGIVSGKKPGFVVTKKGGDADLDRLSAFRSHLRWAGMLCVGLTYGIYFSHTHLAMLAWSLCLLVICLTPPAIALGIRLSIRRQNRNAPAVLTTEKEASHA
jgi:cellulose synthase/poly-beta-1,6-N-acetylglucosamine synthase-like glycosyltransferase